MSGLSLKWVIFRIWGCSDGQAPWQVFPLDTCGMTERFAHLARKVWIPTYPLALLVPRYSVVALLALLEIEAWHRFATFALNDGLADQETTRRRWELARSRLAVEALRVPFLAAAVAFVVLSSSARVLLPLAAISALSAALLPWPARQLLVAWALLAIACAWTAPRPESARVVAAALALPGWAAATWFAPAEWRECLIMLVHVAELAALVLMLVNT